MTVGIAAISQECRNPKVVLAADRMITTGQNPQLEYEHTKSKIQIVYDNDVVSCMGVASGAVSFIEDFFYRLEDKLDDSEPVSVRDIAEKARDAYTELGQDTVENQVLSQLGFELSDLSEDQEKFDSDVLGAMLEDVAEVQNEYAQQLGVVLGGIDGFGGQIFSIENFDLNPQNTIGYHAVGSGTHPARAAFIRNGYDTKSDLQEGILNTIEAKHRSEDARGVGSEMDLAVVTQPSEGEDCCIVLEDDEKTEWISLYEDVIEAEKEAREDVINRADLEFNTSDQT